MTLKDLPLLFNRAVASAWAVQKFLFLFCTLFLSGLLYLFFQGMALFASPWIQVSLKLIPLFLMLGMILGSGMVLIRLYAKEREGEKPSLMATLTQSWDLLLKGAYLALPLLLLFLLFWVLLGIFILLKAIPYLGTFLGIILAFAPFLLNLATLLLFLCALSILFFFAPPFALTQQLQIRERWKSLRSDLFTHLVLLFVAYFPVWLIWKWLEWATRMTFQIYGWGESSLEMLLQGIFILIPLAALFAPIVNFFFNFALEAYYKSSQNSS